MSIVTENIFDIELLVEKLEAALSDQVLGRMPLTWSDWEGIYRKFPISSAGWELIDFLRNPIFAKFQEKNFCMESSSKIVNIGLLATWLVNQASKVGSIEASQQVIRSLNGDKNKLIKISVIPALALERDTQLDHNLLLTSRVPEGINLENFLELVKSTGNNSFPYTFLVERKLVHAQRRLSDEEFHAQQNIENYKWQAVSILGLFTNRESPGFLGMWTLLEKDTPFSGKLDGHRISFPELKLPQMMEELNSEQIIEYNNVLNSYLNIPIDQRRPIETGLFRLSQAMNTMNNVQQAIDLGIALEALLIPDKSQKRISHHFSLIGASLLATDLDEQKYLYSFFRKIYQYRSDAVHQGYLSEKSTEEPISASLFQGIKKAQQCFLASIRLGGVSQKKFNQLVQAWRGQK